VTETLAYNVIANDVGATRTFDRVSDGMDDAGRSADAFGRNAEQLNRKIAETEKHLQSLVDQVDGTEDKELFRAIRHDRNLLNFLKSVHRQLEQIGDQAAIVATKTEVAVSDGIGSAIGAIPSQLKGAAIVIGAPLVAALTPTIGAAVGGAVLGGVGAGGIIGGVIAAAQDERIQDAGAVLGENFMAGFKSAGQAFIAPILDQMSTLQRAENVFLSDLTSGFAKLAPVVKPVAEGIEGLVQNLDLDEAMGDALPAIRAIANELPEIGAAIGDALESIGEDSDGAVMGILTLAHATEDLIRFTGDAVGWLSGFYEWIVRNDNAVTKWALSTIDAASSVQFLFGAIGSPQLDAARKQLQGTYDETQSLIDGLNDANDAGDDWRGNLIEQAKGAREAAKQTQDYVDALKNLFGIQMSLDEAEIRYQQAIDDTLKILKEGKKTLDINEQDGRDNAEAILAQVSAIEDLRQAHIDNGMAIDDANGIADGQLERLRATLIRLGFNKTAVYDLINAYVELKKTAKVTTHVDDKSVQIAYNHVRAVEAEMERLDGTVATTYVRTVFGEFRAGERSPSGRAGGGMVMAGQTYQINEQGIELVEFGRNGRVIPAAPSAAMMRNGALAAGSPEPTTVIVRLESDDEELLRRIRKQVRKVGGGNVQVTYGPTTGPTT